MAERRALQFVRLIEPELCLQCRFGRVARVECVGRSPQVMIHCRRLDCDNWDRGTLEHADVVRIRERDD